MKGTSSPQSLPVSWSVKTFTELTNLEVYIILQLRQDIFVVEQNCPYLDADNTDYDALHVMGMHNGELVAYCRFFTSKNGLCSIGRVVVSSKYRGVGLGYILMEQAEKNLLSMDSPSKIHLSAQEHLRTFYGNLGYVQNGKGYLEDNIPHIPMDKFLNT